MKQAEELQTRSDSVCTGFPYRTVFRDSTTYKEPRLASCIID